MADVEKQCKHCFRWRGANGENAASKMKFCNHMLDTGKRRVEVDGVCKSFLPRKMLATPRKN